MGIERENMIRRLQVQATQRCIAAGGRRRGHELDRGSLRESGWVFLELLFYEVGRGLFVRIISGFHGGGSGLSSSASKGLVRRCSHY